MLVCWLGLSFLFIPPSLLPSFSIYLSSSEGICTIQERTELHGFIILFSSLEWVFRASGSNHAIPLRVYYSLKYQVTIQNQNTPDWPLSLLQSNMTVPIWTPYPGYALVWYHFLSPLHLLHGSIHLGILLLVITSSLPGSTASAKQEGTCEPGHFTGGHL